MSKGAISLFFVVIVFVIVATLLLMRKNNSQLIVPSPTPLSTSTPAPSVKEANFIHEGNLTKPATNWVLIYEKPGSPALQKILVFDSESHCLENGVSSACNLNSFTVGERVKIEGEEKNGAVTVFRLTKSY